jgi:hypothetical protein
MLDTEFGGMNEVLANLYLLSGNANHLTTAQYFDHAEIFDPLAANQDRLQGYHANTQIPKAIGAIREYHATGTTRYRDIAVNFWDIVIRAHTYAIGGNSNGEYFQTPNAIASQLSDSTCETAVLHQPVTAGLPGLLREGSVQPDPRAAEPEFGARLRGVLPAAAARWDQDVLQRLQQLHLRPWHGHGKQHHVPAAPTTSRRCRA